ncbi:MAG TPA: SMP-30/gluconolactonase/LRE family protein [Pirellulales bacterium]|jgi:gluconolactonase|nr:SMP-30/gluconolactonase/LRE family protein [Pirellulales bacterium]
MIGLQKWFAALAMLAVPALCARAEDPQPPRVLKSFEKPYPTFAKITSNDPSFDKLIAPGTKVEKLAEGFAWAEGPLWIKHGGFFICSDIPNNAIRKWKDGEGLSVFLQPSGYTGKTPRGGEPGSNGLTLDPAGHITMCEHGDRRITQLEADGKTKKVLADHYQGKRFNSPNDLVYRSNGDLFFTDPPYGLVKNWDDPARELDFCGVFRLTKEGQLTAVIKDLTRPNGVAFSPDGKTLYIAVSDPDNSVYMAYDMQPDGSVGKGRVFYDMTAWTKEGRPGAPDGMKIDKDGNIWGSGPGGIYVMSPHGKVLGRIDTGERTANVAWGDDGSTLYLCADQYICRVKTGTKGAGW